MPVRGADGSLEMQCQSCHGSMSQVGSTNRVGWFMEPNCQSCHEPETPPGHYPGQCSNCHATTAWKPARYTSAS